MGNVAVAEGSGRDVSAILDGVADMDERIRRICGQLCFLQEAADTVDLEKQFEDYCLPESQQGQGPRYGKAADGLAYCLSDIRVKLEGVSDLARGLLKEVQAYE